MKSPFTTMPVDTSKTFIGRQKELEIINYCIREGEGLSLRGERRSGKTSLLKYTANLERKTYPSHYLIVYITFEEFIDLSLNKIWEQIYNRINKKFKKQFKNQSIENISVQSYNDLSQYLENLESKGVLVFLLIDEFDKIPNNKDVSKNKSLFFSHLRALPHNNKNITYIIATRKGIRNVEHENEEDIDKYASPFFNIFRNWILQPFSEFEAKQLILKYCEPEISELMINDIHFFDEQTGFFPFFFQQLCDCWLKTYQADGNTDRIKEDAKDLFYSQYNEHFEFYWDQSTEDEKKVLMYLSENIDTYSKNTDPPFETFVKIRNQLQNRCLILSRNNQTYRFFSPYFKQICEENNRQQQSKDRRRYHKNIIQYGSFSLIVVLIIFLIIGLFVQEKISQTQKIRNFLSAIHQVTEESDDRRKYLYLIQALKFNPDDHETISKLQTISNRQFKTQFSDLHVYAEKSQFRLYWQTLGVFFQNDIESEDLLKKDIDNNILAYNKRKILARDTNMSNVLFDISHDGRWLSYSQDNKVYVYDLKEQKECVLHKFLTQVREIRYSSSYLIIVNNDNSPLHAWPIDGKSIIDLPFEGRIDRIQVYDSQHVVICTMSPNSRLYLYNITEMFYQTTFEFENANDRVTDFICAPEKQIIVCGHVNGHITFLKLLNDELIITSKLIAHQKAITEMSFSADSQWLISASMDKKLHLWNIAHPALSPVVLPQGDSRVINIAVSQHWAVSVDVNQNIRFWPLQTDQIIKLSCQYLKNKYKQNDLFFISKEEWQTTFDLPYEKTCSEE